MGLHALLLTMLCVTALGTPSAHAETNEAAVGISGGLVSPSISSLSPTAFTMMTWGLGIAGQYGITDNIDLRAGLMFSMFSGRTGDGRLVAPSGQAYQGKLQFDGAYYHPELGLRYKLWAGYDLAPYIEAQVGYLWATYHQPQARYPSGQPINEPFNDFAQGTPTVAAGLAIDYRLLNTVFLGAAVRYVQPLRAQYFQRYITVPITVSFYWF